MFRHSTFTMATTKRPTKPGELELVCIPGREETDEGSWFIYNKVTARAMPMGVGRAGRLAGQKYMAELPVWN